MGFTITVLVACSAVILRGEGEHLGQDFRTATVRERFFVGGLWDGLWDNMFYGKCTWDVPGM